MFFKRFFSFVRNGLAMDLGTVNTLISSQQEGIILNEPSVVAVDRRSKKILSIGREAKEYLGRTPKHILAVRPLRHGVVADFDTTKMMIAYFIRKAMGRCKITKPLIVMGVPTGITQVEKRALVQAGIQAGARDVGLIEEPLAAALGLGLAIEEPVGHMILDVGGGTSEVVAISLSSAICSQSVRIAGDEMDLAIQRYMQQRHSLLIGINTSEKVKIKIGSAMNLKTGLNMDVAGRCLVEGKPRTILVHDWEVREAIKGPVNAIVQSVLRTMEAVPAALMNEISSTGLHLVGGGGLLRGLDSLIAKHSALPVRVDQAPLTTVVRGAARALDDRLPSVFINGQAAPSKCAV